MTGNERVTITALNEIARAIVDVDDAELARLCSLSKPQQAFTPEITTLERLFRERVGLPPKFRNEDVFSKAVEQICKTAARAILEGMFVQHFVTCGEPPPRK